MVGALELSASSGPARVPLAFDRLSRKVRRVVVMIISLPGILQGVLRLISFAAERHIYRVEKGVFLP